METEEKRVNFLLNMENEIDLDDVIREKCQNSETSTDEVFENEIEPKSEEREAVHVNQLFPDLAKLSDFTSVFWPDSPKS